MSYSSKYMRRAILLSERNVDKGGGPFGAIIVKDNKIIATGVNSVTTKNDPTAHAEIVAIRKAAKKLQTFNLSGCEIYTSCEPCPMCLAAIYWAHIDAIYYGNTKENAKEAGFDDSFIYEELKLSLPERKIKTQQYLSDKALGAFLKWNAKVDKTAY